jgi:methylated-DNA-[protein]-cysteine S-methyltransferase
MIEASRTGTFETTLGSCRIGWSDRGLTGIKLIARAAAEAGNSPLLLGSGQAESDAAPPGWVREAAGLIARHLAGEPQDLSGIPLDTEGLPPFHRAVYEAARHIGPGRTVSYGELAAAVGSPRASRAVGQALARNPFLLVVPCHRVLAAGGRPGGFSAPGGLDTKARMLALEGCAQHRSPTHVEAASRTTAQGAATSTDPLAWTAGGSGPT